MAPDDFYKAEVVRLLPYIERNCRFVARRYRWPDADADDFTSEIKLHLLENDYAVLRKFQGRCRIETFLSMVIQNRAKDRMIEDSGKWRPTKVARDLGPVAVQLEELLYRYGHSVDQAWEILRTNHRVAVTRLEIERLVEQLPPRLRRSFVGEVELAGLAAAGGADGALREAERHVQIDQIGEALRAVKESLDPLDRAILAYRYEDGMRIVDIGPLVNVRQPDMYRRLEAIHEQLRIALKARGIDSEILRWFETHD